MSRSKYPSLSRPEIITLSVTFGIVALAIIVGNALTIGAFTKTKLLRRPTHYFLISLAVADLMVGAFAMPLYISHFIDPDLWSASQILQAFYYTLDIISGMASVFTLAVVSIERLYAVGWPWKYRRSSSTAVYLVSVAVTWVLAATISGLYLAFRFNYISDVIHFVTVMLLSVSLAITCASYGGLWVRVKKRRRLRRGLERDKKLATTLFVVTSIFLLTWMPFEIIIIIVHFCQGCSLPPIRLVYAIKLLQYSNSLVNTLVYSLRIPEFRKAIVTFLKSGSLIPDRNAGDRNFQRPALTSVSNLANSCSTVSLQIVRIGPRFHRVHYTKGQRKLAKSRMELFSMQKKKALYSPADMKLKGKV